MQTTEAFGWPSGTVAPIWRSLAPAATDTPATNGARAPIVKVGSPAQKVNSLAAPAEQPMAPRRSALETYLQKQNKMSDLQKHLAPNVLKQITGESRVGGAASAGGRSNSITVSGGGSPRSSSTTKRHSATTERITVFKWVNDRKQEMPRSFRVPKNADKDGRWNWLLIASFVHRRDLVSDYVPDTSRLRSAIYYQPLVKNGGVMPERPEPSLIDPATGKIAAKIKSVKHNSEELFRSMRFSTATGRALTGGCVSIGTETPRNNRSPTYTPLSSRPHTGAASSDHPLRGRLGDISVATPARSPLPLAVRPASTSNSNRTATSAALRILEDRSRRSSSSMGLPMRDNNATIFDLPDPQTSFSGFRARSATPSARSATVSNEKVPTDKSSARAPDCADMLFSLQVYQQELEDFYRTEWIAPIKKDKATIEAENFFAQHNRRRAELVGSSEKDIAHSILARVGSPGKRTLLQSAQLRSELTRVTEFLNEKDHIPIEGREFISGDEKRRRMAQYGLRAIEGIYQPTDAPHYERFEGKPRPRAALTIENVATNASPVVRVPVDGGSEHFGDVSAPTVFGGRNDIEAGASMGRQLPLRSISPIRDSSSRHAHFGTAGCDSRDTSPDTLRTNGKINLKQKSHYRTQPIDYYDEEDGEGKVKAASMYCANTVDGKVLTGPKRLDADDDQPQTVDSSSPLTYSLPSSVHPDSSPSLPMVDYSFMDIRNWFEILQVLPRTLPKSLVIERTPNLPDPPAPLPSVGTSQLSTSIFASPATYDPKTLAKLFPPPSCYANGLKAIERSYEQRRRRLGLSDSTSSHPSSQKQNNNASSAVGGKAPLDLSSPSARLQHRRKSKRNSRSNSLGGPVTAAATEFGISAVEFKTVEAKGEKYCFSDHQSTQHNGSPGGGGIMDPAVSPDTRKSIIMLQSAPLAGSLGRSTNAAIAMNARSNFARRQSAMFTGGSIRSNNAQVRSALMVHAQIEADMVGTKAAKKFLDHPVAGPFLRLALGRFAIPMLLEAEAVSSLEVRGLVKDVASINKAEEREWCDHIEDYYDRQDTLKKAKAVAAQEAAEAADLVALKGKIQQTMRDGNGGFGTPRRFDDPTHSSTRGGSASNNTHRNFLRSGKRSGKDEQKSGIEDPDGANNSGIKNLFSLYAQGKGGSQGATAAEDKGKSGTDQGRPNSPTIRIDLKRPHNHAGGNPSPKTSRGGKSGHSSSSVSNALVSFNLLAEQQRMLLLPQSFTGCTMVNLAHNRLGDTKAGLPFSYRLKLDEELRRATAVSDDKKSPEGTSVNSAATVEGTIVSRLAEIAKIERSNGVRSSSSAAALQSGIPTTRINLSKSGGAQDEEGVLTSDGIPRKPTDDEQLVESARLEGDYGGMSFAGTFLLQRVTSLHTISAIDLSFNMYDCFPVKLLHYELTGLISVAFHGNNISSFKPIVELALGILPLGQISGSLDREKEKHLEKQAERAKMFAGSKGKGGFAGSVNGAPPLPAFSMPISALSRNFHGSGSGSQFGVSFAFGEDPKAGKGGNGKADTEEPIGPAFYFRPVLERSASSVVFMDALLATPEDKVFIFRLPPLSGCFGLAGAGNQTDSSACNPPLPHGTPYFKDKYCTPLQKRLRTLTIHGNPLQKLVHNNVYRQKILLLFPKLTTLDVNPVTVAERSLIL